ncbi:hypothetical protein DSL72_003462 [Monilinia vaccinii-corymbosi]|uniref:RNA polymerase II holoenzyme cyclin-like subunit n=1 Tax=Monilinia vaccinii-corymbosi TaxID=61207 RepID=A0A8A3NTC9_9HELO|nr:hypothetical protein DSL72_003462 [Monilinia vaccinii-corymbosi]
MTTAGPYPIAEFDYPDDQSNNTRPSSPCASTITEKYIPPAVPSPPRLSNHHLAPEQPFRQKKHILIPEMSAKAADQWLFTEAELKATPSILDGLTPEEERIRRAKGVSFMSSIGNMLHIPMTTVSVASLYFHRFYMRRSMASDKKGSTGIHHYEIGATALFLATKTEETIRGTKPFIFACIKVAQKNPKLEVDASSKEYWRWRDSILMYEELMLELLCFDLSAHSPLKYLVNFFEELTAVGIRSETIKELRNYTWALICDTHHSTLGLIATPRTIAITTLMLAATARKCEIPQIKGKDWWEHLGGTEPQIVEAGLILHNFIRNSPFQITDQDQPGTTAAKYLHASSGRKERSSDDTLESSGQVSSQTENGHVHGNGTSGSDSNSQPDPEPHNDQITANNGNIKPRASSTTDEAQTSPALPNVHNESENFKSQDSGTDDAPLKAAANDLSSHDQIKSANDDSSNIGCDIKVSPKRKADQQIEEGPRPKRVKGDSTSSETIVGDPEPSPEGDTMLGESQGTVKNEKYHAARDVEPVSDTGSENAATRAEVGVGAAGQHEEGELEQ